MLREFWLKHKDCKKQLQCWYEETSNSEWKSSHDIKREFPSASILGDSIIVFNIKGNQYRLIIKINFNYQMVWIRFIGTHAEYDKIAATET